MRMDINSKVVNEMDKANKTSNLLPKFAVIEVEGPDSFFECGFKVNKVIDEVNTVLTVLAKERSNGSKVLAGLTFGDRLRNHVKDNKIKIIFDMGVYSDIKFQSEVNFKASSCLQLYDLFAKVSFVDDLGPAKK